MGFAARPVSGVAFVEMGFILDMHALRRESGQQFCGDDILQSHHSLSNHFNSHDTQP